MTTNRVKEFDAFPMMNIVGGKTVIESWDGKISIDFRWVAGAFPGAPGNGSTDVILAGSGRNQAITIRCAYSEFVEMWTRRRRSGSSRSF